MTRFPLHNFAGLTAIVLHRSDEPMRRVVERCDRLGIRALPQTGELQADTAAMADMVILDIDTGHDGQLPWDAGQAPVPLIGLVGSESPGRLAWAMGQGVDAYLPISALGNLFSALVIAHETFARKVERFARDQEVARQRAGRLDVIRAVLLLMSNCGNDALALKQLRAMAMVEQTSLEEAAARLLAERQPSRAGGK